MKALLLREWGIVRRVVRIASVVITLGIVFLFVACAPDARYRMLAEPVMMRSLVLPAALATGAAIGWMAIVREMREGTWESWLLLPRSRGVLVAAKVTVGLASTLLTLAAPIAGLALTLRLWGSIGGPSVSLGDLLFRSALTQGVLIGVVTYLATANAALMARFGHVGFFAPLLLPVLATSRFFVGVEGFHSVPDSWLELGLVATAALLLLTFVVGVRGFGRPPGASDLSLRALVVVPSTTLVILFGCLVLSEISERFHEEPSRRTLRDAGSPSVDERLGIDTSGHIVALRGKRREPLSMYQMKPFEKIEEPRESRVWTPSFTGQSMQGFRDRERNVFLVFENGSGKALGCLGASGLAFGGEPCVPFDGAPVTVAGSSGQIVLTSRGAAELDDRGHVTPVLHGVVHGAVMMGTIDGSDQVAVAIGDGLSLLSWGPDESESAVDDDGSAPESAGDERDSRPPLRVASHCDGIVHDDAFIDKLAVNHDFVGIELSFASAPLSTELVVCRGGVVVERSRFDEPQVVDDPEARPIRRGFLAFALGPLGAEIVDHFSLASVRSRVVSVVGAAGATLSLMLIALGVQRRRGRKERLPLSWMLPGLVLGPGYAFACALVLWRRPRWSTWVG